MDILARLADWPINLGLIWTVEKKGLNQTLFLKFPALNYPEYVIKKIRVARLGHVIVKVVRVLAFFFDLSQAVKTGFAI